LIVSVPGDKIVKDRVEETEEQLLQSQGEKRFARNLEYYNDLRIAAGENPNYFNNQDAHELYELFLRKNKEREKNGFNILSADEFYEIFT